MPALQPPLGTLVGSVQPSALADPCRPHAALPFPGGSFPEKAIPPRPFGQPSNSFGLSLSHYSEEEPTCGTIGGNTRRVPVNATADTFSSCVVSSQARMYHHFSKLVRQWGTFAVGRHEHTTPQRETCRDSRSFFMRQTMLESVLWREIIVAVAYC